MSCIVYCLAPRPEQLDSVVEEVKDAGVDARHIVVMPRRSWLDRQPNGRLSAEMVAALFDKADAAATEAETVAARVVTLPSPPRKVRTGPPALADCLLPAMWLPFAPATWWWEWATGTGNAVGNVASSVTRSAPENMADRRHPQPPSATMRRRP